MKLEHKILKHLIFDEKYTRTVLPFLKNSVCAQAPPTTVRSLSSRRSCRHLLRPRSQAFSRRGTPRSPATTSSTSALLRGRSRRRRTRWPSSRTKYAPSRTSWRATAPRRGRRLTRRRRISPKCPSCPSSRS